MEHDDIALEAMLREIDEARENHEIDESTYRQRIRLWTAMAGDSFSLTPHD